VFEGGFRVPAMIRWPGKVPAGKVENGIISGLDWFPTFLAAAGNPNIVAELKQGKQIGDTTYKVHLDGYDQTNMIIGKGPSNHHECEQFSTTANGAPASFAAAGHRLASGCPLASRTMKQLRVGLLEFGVGKTCET
jgi:arylsulfatase A-like enzyme